MSANSRTPDHIYGSMWIVHVDLGGKPDGRFFLGNPTSEVTVGRPPAKAASETPDVVVHEKSVSKVHALLVLAADGSRLIFHGTLGTARRCASWYVLHWCLALWTRRCSHSRPCCGCCGVPPYRHPPGRTRRADKSRYGTTINGVKHQGGSVPLSDGDRAQLAPKAFLTWVVGRVGGVPAQAAQRGEGQRNGTKDPAPAFLATGQMPRLEAGCALRQECADGRCGSRHAAGGGVMSDVKCGCGLGRASSSHRVAACCSLFGPAASRSSSWWCVCRRGTAPWRTCSGRHTQWVGAGCRVAGGPLVSGLRAWTVSTSVLILLRVYA